MASFVTENHSLFHYTSCVGNSIVETIESHCQSEVVAMLPQNYLQPIDLGGILEALENMATETHPNGIKAPENLAVVETANGVIYVVVYQTFSDFVERAIFTTGENGLYEVIALNIP